MAGHPLDIVQTQIALVDVVAGLKVFEFAVVVYPENLGVQDFFLRELAGVGHKLLHHVCTKTVLVTDLMLFKHQNTFFEAIEHQFELLVLLLRCFEVDDDLVYVLDLQAVKVIQFLVKIGRN